MIRSRGAGSGGQRSRPSAVEARPSAVVAIPVRNEEDRIGACLMALSEQTGIAAAGLGVVLLLNNCTDGTARVAASLAERLGLPLRLIERDHEGANAGWARREAMEEAARWLEPGGANAGVILTTDADSRVPADWVARNLAGIAAGADAVAGRIALDEEDAARLPAGLRARGRLEGTYEALLVEIEALLDPLLHDPWPRHRTTSGASLAVRLAAYRRVGGMPPLALGEDKAFVSSLLSSDALVRHDPEIVVTTSGRLEGRAPGGAADTMRLRCEMPDSPCDPALEPLRRALVRYASRRRIRRLHASRSLGRTQLWAPWLGLAPDHAAAIARLPALGAVLAAVEQASRRLASRPLRPGELRRQIGFARTALFCLRGGTLLTRRLRAIGPVAAVAPAGRPEQAGL